jgi:outer membrane receptor protein involved in Fe transport
MIMICTTFQSGRRRALQAIGAAAALSLSAPLIGAEPVAQENSKEQSSTLGTVIVTAQKRSEDIQNVPMSIGVIDASQLENLHATQLADYAAYIPGFTVINTGAPGQARLGIRGISPLGENATVATYIDEMPIGSSSLYGRSSYEVLDLLPNDFQSVEVLRGPQGTLYGASALAGVVRYVSKAPDLTTPSWQVGANVFGVSGGGDLGSGGHAGFSTPLIADRLALGVSFARQNSPGYTDNVQTGEKNQDSFWQRAGRATLLWKASDDISFTLAAIDSKSDARSAAFTALDPATLRPLYGDLKNDNYFREPYIKSYGIYAATLNWNLGFADFVSATTYARTDSHSSSDGSLVYGMLFPLFGLPDAGLAKLSFHLKLNKTTQEFRLTSKEGDRIEWLVGVFATRENSTQDQYVTAQLQDYSFIEGLNPLGMAGLPATYKEYATYANLTYKFTGNFDVTAGVRWARNEQNFAQITNGALTPADYVPGSSAENVFTYSLSPRLHLGVDTMLYARIASGYQPGGPNVALPGVPPSVDSSTITSYEAGIKTMLADRRVMLDADIYDIQWNKIQVLTAGENGLGYIANGGTARSRGLEFSALYMPVAELRLGLNGAYTDAVLTEDAPDISGLNGDRLPNAPKWAASATADYSFPMGNGWTGRIGGGLRHAGSTMSMVAHAPTALPQAGYTALDLNAALSNERWTLRLFAKNVTDNRAYPSYDVRQNALTGEISHIGGVPLTPRTIGIGFDLTF